MIREVLIEQALLDYVARYGISDQVRALYIFDDKLHPNFPTHCQLTKMPLDQFSDQSVGAKVGQTMDQNFE